MLKDQRAHRDQVGDKPQYYRQPSQSTPNACCHSRRFSQALIAATPDDVDLHFDTDHRAEQAQYEATPFNPWHASRAGWQEIPHP